MESIRARIFLLNCYLDFYIHKLFIHTFTNKLMSMRLDRIKKAVFERPYVFYFWLIFILYITLNVIINQNYITFKTFFTSYRPSFYVPYIIFNLIVSFLVPLNINLAILKFKDLSFNTKGEEGISVLGVIAGLIGGSCPGCIAGLFPAILGLFGVSAGLSILPFYGLEIQALSIVLLIIGAVLLSRETVCKIPNKKLNKKKKL